MFVDVRGRHGFEMKKSFELDEERRTTSRRKSEDASNE